MEAKIYSHAKHPTLGGEYYAGARIMLKPRTAPAAFSSLEFRLLSFLLASSLQQASKDVLEILKILMKM